KQLYEDSTWQPNPNYSLITDTAVYFLTYSPTTAGKRFTPFTDTDYSNPFPYFIKESYLEESQEYNVGYPDQDVDYVNAEGHVGTTLSDANPVTVKSINTQNVFAAGPNFEIKTTITGSNNNAQDYAITAPGINFREQFIGYQVRNNSFSIAPALFTNTSTNFTYTLYPQGAGYPTNRISFVNLSVKYPHTPDMENASSFKMYVPDDVNFGRTALNLTNFNNAASGTVLYDITNHKRIYVTQNNSNVSTVIPNDGSANPKFCVLASSGGINTVAYQAISRINYVFQTGPSRFNNIQSLAVDSAYIIITNAGLKNAITIGGGYKDYRNITTGNHNRVVVVDAAELYDQFGYGISNHGRAVRNFVHFILDKWNVPKPQSIFLVGKSIEPYSMRHNPGLWSICQVGSYGYPTSDLAMAYGVNGSLFEPAIPIGRLSANNQVDIANYLNKVKEYEGKQNAATPESWMKEVLHFGGGENISEQDAFRSNLNSLKDVIQDTLYGGHVTSFFKNSPDPVEFGLTAQIKNAIDNGVSMMLFFGHASGSSFDIATDLPSNYTNYGRYPIIMASSCFAGNFHTHDQSNSEAFVMAQGKAAIAFLASVGLGDAYYLYLYDTSLYRNISYRNYGEPIGKIMQHTIQCLQDNYNGNSGIKRVVNEMSLQGDPMLRYNSWPKPDLVAEESNISFTPNVITADMDTFSIHFKTRNYAQAVSDTFRVTITRTLPNGVDSVYTIARPRCYYEDDLSINMKVSGLNGAGINTFTVKVDLNPDTIPEMQDVSNNIATTSLFIYSNDIIPIYPPKYAIHPYSTVTLKASTANPLGTMRTYKFEIDTSYFNDDPGTHSPLYRFNFIQSSGGVVSWSPANYSLLPNTVYYWRVYDDTTTVNKNESSFIYIPNKTGWSQAHFFQFRKDGYENASQDSTQRIYQFGQNVKSLDVTDYGSPSQAGEYNATGYTLNGEPWEYNFCQGIPSIHVVVIDSLTLIPWNTCNNNVGQANTFTDPNGDCITDVNTIYTCRARAENYFIFRCGDPAQILAMRNFVNSVPNGNYIVMYSAFPFAYSGCGPDFSGALTDLGFNAGLVQDNLPFIFYTQRGNSATDTSIFGSAPNSLITLNRVLETKWYRGTITSEVIGPATSWTNLHWGEHQLENGATADSASINIYGFNQALSKWDTLVTGIQTNTPDYSLSGISATQYPYLKLNAYLEDLPLRTPPQMDRWQIYFDEAPECALNASRTYSFYKNPVSEGDTVKLSIAVDNIGNVPMDSLGMTFYMYDRDRTRHDIKTYKLDSLRTGQSLTASVTIDSTFGLYGENSLWVEANPFGNLHQLEQFHFNNIAEVKFNINRDVVNPILDVTFDAIHILDGDIVSGKPHIVVQLHDENKFLALNDTSNFRVYLKSPSQNSKQQLNFNDQFYSAGMRFIPAILPKNSCKIEFDPVLLEDGIYTLEVEAADRSKNESGKYNYKITFEVINKSTITEILNYPNPFSTSTRFVFVLTGNEVPDHMKIRIMTVSGKVVREIMKNELGNIHIGRNITDYAWDGKDEFGDQLANGVYIYRVYTDFSNGNDLEHRESEADKYFKKGWGKMYLMR
ncbi:MAG: C25 family cysteine peptidase, partial [Bacteroidota bacterium]